MLCIIPDNSEFRTRLMMAARGRLLPLIIGNCCKTALDTAYLLFEFSSSHRMGSGCFLVGGGIAARIGLYLFKAGMSGRAMLSADELGTKHHKANAKQKEKTTSRPIATLSVVANR